ncbi:MAG: nitrilase-related carbon-nitrogen hydrolase [Thermodesulfobacteriota bacterium]|nr:nitrilase-related carbon-nitrogen hydrolase [Thermodesulfobacteriota bacterium]
MRDIRLAAGIMRAVAGDKDGNLERTRQLVSKAASQGAEIILLPEACLSGYTVREPMDVWAEPVPGPLTQALTGLAREFGLVISAGLVEKGLSGSIHLTQVLTGPDGLVGLYRKTHLGPTEKNLFEPGEILPVFELSGVKFGIQLCYEGHFPEISLTQALGGAEVLLIPHASPREEPDLKLARWLKYLPARAYDNSLFVAACNLVGDNGRGLTFAGAALILGPKGEVLAQTAGREDDLIVAGLCATDLAAVRQSRMGFFLASRRPKLYQ